MECSLHPELAKRIVHPDPTSGRSHLAEMSALALSQLTRARSDRGPTPRGEQQKDVTVLDIFEDMASAKIVASTWIDYLHLARFNDRWVIANVLWQMKTQAPVHGLLVGSASFPEP